MVEKLYVGVCVYCVRVYEWCVCMCVVCGECALCVCVCALCVCMCVSMSEYIVYVCDVCVFVGCCLATKSLNYKVEWVEVLMGVAVGC